MKLKKLFYTSLLLLGIFLHLNSYSVISFGIIAPTATDYYNPYAKTTGTYSGTTKNIEALFNSTKWNGTILRARNDSGTYSVTSANGRADKIEVTVPLYSNMGANAIYKATPAAILYYDFINRGNSTSYKSCNTVNSTTVTANAGRFCMGYKTPTASNTSGIGFMNGYSPAVGQSLGFTGVLNIQLENRYASNVVGVSGYPTLAVNVTSALPDGLYDVYAIWGDPSNPTTTYASMWGDAITFAQYFNQVVQYEAGKGKTKVGTINVATYTDVISKCVNQGVVDTTRPANSGNDVFGRAKTNYCTGGLITFGSTAGSPLQLTDGSPQTLSFEDVITVYAAHDTAVSLSIWDCIAHSGGSCLNNQTSTVGQVRTAWLDAGLYMTYKIITQTGTISSISNVTSGVIEYTLPLNTRPNSPSNGLRKGKFRVTITLN